MEPKTYTFSDPDLELLRISLMTAIVDVGMNVFPNEAVSIIAAYREMLDRFGGPIPVSHEFLHPAFHPA